MNPRVPKTRHLSARPHRAAFSLVEVVVSMLIVSLLFVASLSAVSASQASRHTMAERVRGEQLAHDLLSEVLRFGYDDPTGANGLGPEAGEVGGSRALFDDADDYHGWTASPPQTRDGDVLAGFAGWGRHVTVAYVDPADPTAAATSAHRAKLITVTVTHGGRTVAQLQAIRTAAMSDFNAHGVFP